MSRNLKRVPIDFNWPVGKKWHGFINPHYKKCPHCQGGYTTGRKRLNNIIRLLLLSGSDAAKGTNHPYFERINNVASGDWLSIPSNDLAELTGGLAGRKPDGLFGHDAIDNWSATAKIIKAAGLNKKWGICTKCKGDDLDPIVKKAYYKWKETPIPIGEGFQLWEDTSEGSPKSPVFLTLELLCAWCEDNATTFAHFKTTKEEWYKMLSNDNVIHKEGNFLFL